VREVDSCAQGNLKISLLSRILTLGSSSVDSAGQNKTSIHPAQDLEVDYEGLNKHDPKLALLQAQQEQNHRLNQSDQKPESPDGSSSGITILDSWKIPNANDGAGSIDETAGQAKVTANEEIAPVNLKSLILYSEKAKEHTPPNHFDLHLHYVIPESATDGILPRSTWTSKPTPSVCSVPFLSGARVLQNVFTDDECERLIQIATTLGYRPDHPKTLTEPTGIDSCEWLIPDSKWLCFQLLLRMNHAKQTNCFILTILRISFGGSSIAKASV